MKILHVVGGLPSKKFPHYQPFVKSQIDSIMEEGIDSYVFEIRGYDSPLNYCYSIYKLKRIVKQKKIDLIHAHYSYSALVPILANVKVPIVLSLMGSDLLGRPNIMGKLTLRGKLDQAISVFVSRKVDHLIVKSARMKKLLKVSVPISVIPNGVDLNQFFPKDKYEARRNLSLQQDEFLILFFGDPKNPRKNYKLAQLASEQLQSRNKKDAVKLLNPYGVEHSKVVDYLNAADVLLLTSYWEGSPNIIKESLACNLPIISTDVGDVSELIKDTNNSYLVGFDATEITDKLQRMLNSRKRSNGRENIKHLEIQTVANKIIKLYERLLLSNKKQHLVNHRKVIQ